MAALCALCALCGEYLLPASSFQLPASSFQLPASSFQLPASSFQLPAASTSWSPRWPVQHAVADRLADVVDADAAAPGEVADGARHLQDAVVGAGAEAEVADR